MFEMSDRFSPESADEAYDNNRPLNIDQVIPQSNQKDFSAARIRTISLRASALLLPRFQKWGHAELGHR